MKKIIALGFISVIVSMPVHASDNNRGKQKAAICAGCHGTNGVGISQEFPNLAGQKQVYILNQLKAFKSGMRKDPTMMAMVSALTDSDMIDLAAYFSSIKSRPMAKTDTPTAMDKATSKEFPESTFISMKKDGTIQNFPQQQIWTGGPNMLYDAVSPDGKILLSTSPSTNTVYAFESNSGKQLAVIKVGKAPKGVKISPDGKVAYISNQGSANISVIDLKKLTVVNRIEVGQGPHNVRFTRDGKVAYVTLQGGAGIGVIDVATNQMTNVIPIAGVTGPHNLDLSSDEKIAFVRDFVHHVAVVDLVSGKVLKIITVGNGHGGIDVTPDGRYAATAAIADTYVSIIDTKTLDVKNIEVGNGPHGIRASKDSHWLYVTLTKDNAIAVVNLQTMHLEKKIAVGKFPFWIAVQGNP